MEGKRPRGTGIIVLAVLTGLLCACGGGSSGGGGDTSPPQPPPPTITAVSVVCNPTTINAGSTSACTVQVTGTGSFISTVTWTSSNTAVATVSNAGAVTGVAQGTATLTATSTEDATKSGSVSITVKRTITLSLDSTDGNALLFNEVYLDWPSLVGFKLDCAGCEATDTFHAQDFLSNTATPWSQLGSPLGEFLNYTGAAWLPRLDQLWITGTDGVTSNTINALFAGNENEAVEDSSSGEMYFYDWGNRDVGSFALLKFKSDGTPDGNLTNGGTFGPGGGLALDSSTQTLFGSTPFPLESGINGVVIFSTNGDTITNGYTVTNGEPTAIDANDGLACTTISSGNGSPNKTDAVDCWTQGTGIFTLSGIPLGSQPIALRVMDASDVVVYCRGDQTLRWYAVSVSGTAATSSSLGTLQLPDLTPIDAGYWKTFPWTGGWHLVAVEPSILGIMGEVAGTATVTQELVLVNVTKGTGSVTMAVSQTADLPMGTLQIAADETNNAVVAEYPDFSGTAPVMRFVRVYADTGNVQHLGSTSSLVPGSGLLVTKDGSKIGVFGMGKADFVANQ